MKYSALKPNSRLVVKGIAASLLLAGTVLLSGCGQKSPMEQLHSEHQYADMNNAFWANQQSRDTPLWKKAVNYCTAHSGKPNCSSVMQVYVISNGSTNVPAYGSSGETIHLPTFKNVH